MFRGGCFDVIKDETDSSICVSVNFLANIDSSHFMGVYSCEGSPL